MRLDQIAHGEPEPPDPELLAMRDEIFKVLENYRWIPFLWGRKRDRMRAALQFASAAQHLQRHFANPS
jgi:hypothetical protein